MKLFCCYQHFRYNDSNFHNEYATDNNEYMISIGCNQLNRKSSQ